MESISFWVIESAYLRTLTAAVVDKKLAHRVDEAKPFTKGFIVKNFLIIINYDDYFNT